MNIEDIPYLIKGERINQGMTQMQLARRSNVSQQLISLIEHGDINISLKTLFKLMRALNIHLVINQKVG